MSQIISSPETTLLAIYEVLEEKEEDEYHHKVHHQYYDFYQQIKCSKKAFFDIFIINDQIYVIVQKNYADANSVQTINHIHQSFLAFQQAFVFF